MLRQRVISAVVAIPIILAAIWFGDPWLSIVVALFVLLGAFEFYRLGNSAGWQPFTIIGIVLALLFILNTHSDDEKTTPLLITGAVLIPLARIIWQYDGQKAFVNWTWTVAGIFYVGWMMSHIVQLRDMDDGRDWVIIAIFATFASDTSAYFTGRALGKHKMAPAISPGKTWEGAIGGLLGAAIATVVLAIITGIDEIGYLKIIPLGFLISIFAQAGDLTESALKRNASAKDAGSLIPGHGGVLDRLDSLIFTVVLVYYYVIWIVY
ncbi:MAG: phosphatidate cytidylyltransferase [Chloroflexi bacterium]|nr:phosphatidate cytidylyltransferase [Chloroflexota bacterium]